MIEKMLSRTDASEQISKKRKVLKRVAKDIANQKTNSSIRHKDKLKPVYLKTTTLTGMQPKIIHYKEKHKYNMERKK